MRNVEHPAYHHLARKLRRLYGLLTNFEEPLRADGFDYDEYFAWVARHMGTFTDEEADDAALEKETFDRMERVLKFLFVHAPGHQAYPNYRLYHQLWRECYGEPIRPLSDVDRKHLETADEPVIAPAIYGVPIGRLEAARARMGEMKLSKGMAPFLMFNCGLIYALGYFGRHQAFPEHKIEDGLLEAAREALESAVDFANEPETIRIAKEGVAEGIPEDEHRLAAGIYYVSLHHTSSVYEWLHRSELQRNLMAMLFAMGVRALTDPYAKNLVMPWIENCKDLNDWLTEEMKALLHDFFNQD